MFHVRCIYVYENLKGHLFLETRDNVLTITHGTNSFNSILNNLTILKHWVRLYLIMLFYFLCYCSTFYFSLLKSNILN